MTSILNTASRIALLAALIGTVPMGAFAQESSDTAEQSAAETDVIVVTGYRRLNAQAIEAKRDAVGILDAVSQDEIGLLPDLTISDVARRIPGVTTISQGGPEGVRSVNAEQNIVIRGLDPSFNLTTFDGVPIASTSEDERAANLSVFPPTVVARIEAIKTLTADLNPHALSGQLNLVTLSAFDRDDSFFTSRASIGSNSTSGEGLEDEALDVRASAAYTSRFGDAEQFGMVLSASYEEFHDSSFDLRPGAASNTYLFYDADLTSNSTVDAFADSNGFPTVRRPQLYLFDGSRERVSAVAKFEYQPSDQTFASLFLGTFLQNEQEVRHEFLAISDSNVRPENQTLFTGDWTRANVQPGYVNQPEESQTFVITGQFSHDIDEDRTIAFTGSVSRAEVDIIRNMSKFLLNPRFTNQAGYSYDLSSGQPSLEFNDPDFINDLSNYVNSYIRDRSQTIQQDLAYFSGSYAQNFETYDRGFGFEVGFNYTRRDQSFDREYIEGDVFDASGNLIGFDAFVEDLVLPATYDPRVNFYLIDDAALRAAWDAQGKTITNDRSDNSISDDYQLNEQLLAAYGQVSYRTDRFSLVAGLRYDNAQADIDLFVRDDTLVPGHVNDSDYYVPLSRSNDYANWLPSVISSFELQPDLLLRAGYGRTIGRPNFRFLALSERIGESNDVEQTISITRGNPDLEPLVSDNLDVSLERYLDGGRSLVSVAAFYKNVDGLIYTQTVTDPNFEYEGEIYTATLRQPINTTASSIYGIEASLRKDFADTFDNWLSGFVFESNLTWIGSDFTFVNAEGDERSLDGWENQPEFLANVQLSYEQGPFGAKIAYNHVGDFLSSILADEGDLYNMYRDPRGVFDVQARYQVTDSLRLIAEVQNLTEEGVQYSRQFPDSGELLAADVERGRAVWLGVSWTPGL